MNQTASARFDLLDGLRGAAAIAVMIYHYTQHNGLYWLGGAWAAVDLFFILSGLVIAHSYGAKILTGMTLRQFFVVRLIRLGPLYLLGLVLGLTAILMHLAKGAAASVSTDQVASAFVLGLVWLPYFNQGQWPFGTEFIGGPIFPLNEPAWSLFFEMLVNVLFFFFVCRYRKYSNIWLVSIASAVFIYCTIALHQIGPGWGAGNFIYGFPRVLAEFFAGALIYSLRLHERKFPVVAVALIGTTSLVFMFAGSYSKYALINSIVLIPLLVVFFSSIGVAGWARPWVGVLGSISYPIYIIHVPVYRLLFELIDTNSVKPATLVFLAGALSLLLSLLLVPIDLQVRKWLSARLASRQALARSH